MKKNILMLAVLAVCGMSYAQEKMKVELKNGNVVSYNVEDVNRFYFVTEEEKDYADYCEVEIEDETVMTTDAIFELDYDIDVDYARFLFFKASEVRQLSEEQIVELVKSHSASGQIEKDKNLLYKDNLEEGGQYACVLLGFNADNSHGAPVIHYFQTKVSAVEPIVNVVNARYDTDYFYFDTEIDDDKVLEYYMLTEVGNDLESIQESAAIFGYAWKLKIEEDEKMAGQNYIGKSFTEPRTNGANTLLVVTWARDNEVEFSGVIRENRIKTNPSSRQQVANRSIKATHDGTKTFAKAELLSRLQIKKIR